MPVDGPVQIAPFAADLNVGLVNPDRPAVWLKKLAKPLLDHRRVGQYPAIDCAVFDFKPTLAKHPFQIRQRSG